MREQLAFHRSDEQILTGINCRHSIIATNHKNHVVDDFNAEITSRRAHFPYR